METPAGPASGHLTPDLADNIRGLDFFACLRRLESTLRTMPRIGAAALPSQDAIRFAQEPSLAFAPTTFERVDSQVNESAPRLVVRFLGLLGPNGPLPVHLTDYARQRIIHHNDPTFAHFLDMFHHRLISLFYRAWAGNQQTVSFDRYEPGKSAPLDDAFTFYSACLVGCGTDAILAADTTPPLSKMHYAAWLTGAPRHPDGLRNILSDFFSAPCAIEEFTGRWISLPRQYQCRLGESANTACLGQTMVCGARIWDVQGTFTVVLGPMNLPEFENLLPGSSGHRCLRDWVRLYAGPEMAWSLRLVLAAAAVPCVRLGQSGRLGYTTWLRTAPLNRDADEFRLVFDEAA